MPNALRLEESEDTPKVVLDSENERFEISGRSLPEDAIGFFAPILTWMNEYIQTPNKYTELSVKLDYFNSASSKQLVDLMILLEKVNEMPDKGVIVMWGYEKEDDIMKIRGQEMESIIELSFRYNEF